MSTDAALKTPLYSWHQSHGGRIVEFGGWLMPVQYNSIVEEHQAVRQRAGLFDISHMGRLTFEGPDALPWLEHVTTNHVAKLAVNQIQYSLMANGGGGLIDDVLVYRSPDGYFLVCNASNRAHVLAQLERHREDARVATLVDRTPDTAMIAVQGPLAAGIVGAVFDGDLAGLKYYHMTMGRLLGDVDVVISRTGYTGEDGYELVVAAGAAERVWEGLLEVGKPRGLAPCGLGARDTLRFEAAMPLYGHEMNEAINPYAAGLGWAVKLGKGPFVGRDALSEFKAKPGQVRVGLQLDGKRIARQGCEIFRDGGPVGLVTSGTFSPTLQRSLAMALVDPASAEPGQVLSADVRGHHESATVVPLPFYKKSATAE